RHLGDGKVVLRLDYAADHHGAAILDQNGGGGLLRVQGRVQLLAGHAAEVGRGVFHVDAEKDGVFSRDLRSHGEAQERADVLDRRRATQLRLGHDGNLSALLDGGRDVVLRRQMWTRQNFDQPTRFRQAQDEVQAEVLSKGRKAKAAGRSAGRQV